MAAISQHERAKDGTAKEDWITPRYIIEALGPFDLDPCAHLNRPWPTAHRHYTIRDNGLLLPWEGRVWLNPPYNRYELPKWMRLMPQHSGTALLFARPGTKVWQRYVFPRATAILFLSGRQRFCLPDGTPSRNDCGGDSALIAYGEHDADRLEHSGLVGQFIRLINQ